MISAIAARKAALAAKSQPITSPLPSSPQDTPPPSSPGPSKRKSVATIPEAARKRKKKAPTSKPKPARYFEEQTEEDLIVLPSSDDEGNVSPEDLSGPEEMPQSTFNIPAARRWSPSGSYPVQPVSIPDLSTFSPVAGENLFTLTPEELASFSIESDPSTTSILLSLTDDETITLVGVYSLTILSGTITLLGVSVTPSSRRHRIYAPRSSPLPVLSSMSGVETHLPFQRVPQHIQPAFVDGRTVIVIQDCHSNIEGLEVVCRNFTRVFAAPVVEMADLGLVSATMVSQPSKELQPYVAIPSWMHVLSSLSHTNESVSLVKGPKRSGKSSFARTLVNNLLNRYKSVAYLECDLGQSEFVPGGMVALNVISEFVLGPPFTHPTLPATAHYMGAFTPISSPSHYLAAIQATVDHYRLDIRTPVDTDMSEDNRITDFVPLVVNTMGWNKGLGADLSQKIEELVVPTHVYDFGFQTPDEGGPNSTMDSLYTYGRPEPKLYTLDSAPLSILTSNYSAADHRSLSLLSYFHAIFPSQGTQLTAKLWNISLPLCATPPYEVDVKTAVDKVVLLGSGAEDVHVSEIGRVLNGAVVGLLSCEPGLEDANLPSGPIPYTQGGAAPSPLSSACHGLALIRSVSPTNTHLHVLSPLPASSLGQCRVIAKGQLELPIWGMLDFRSDMDDVAGVEAAKVPYLQWGRAEGLGGDKRRIRRNLMRRGQM